MFNLAKFDKIYIKGLYQQIQWTSLKISPYQLFFKVYKCPWRHLFYGKLHCKCSHVHNSCQNFRKLITNLYISNVLDKFEIQCRSIRFTRISTWKYIENCILSTLKPTFLLYEMYKKFYKNPPKFFILLISIVEILRQI